MACNIIYQADPGDLRPEKGAFAEKLFDFFYPESDVPLRTYEKRLLRVWVHYEALGAGQWKVEGFNRRGTPTAEQTLTIPSLSDGSVQIATFDLQTSDDVIKVRITPVCGPMSIIYTICDFIPNTGQVRKGT